ncbi:MAG: hypothetical protein ABSA51_08375 [Anaerolineaceae bacterium]
MTLHHEKTYAAEAPLQFLGELLCGRYFVERVIQDSKDEVGADEFQAQKYIAWEHHTALTVIGKPESAFRFVK